MKKKKTETFFHAVLTGSQRSSTKAVKILGHHTYNYTGQTWDSQLSHHKNSKSGKEHTKKEKELQLQKESEMKIIFKFKAVIKQVRMTNTFSLSLTDVHF